MQKGKRAKRRVHGDQKDESVVVGSDRLPLGPQHRQLPQHIDQFMLGFLDLCDLSALFLCSHAQHAQVARCLSTMKTLKIVIRPGSPLAEVDSDDGPLAPKLALRYCRALEQIVDAQPTNTGESEFGMSPDLFQEWLLELVRKNHNTLRSIPEMNAAVPGWGEVLVLCSNLETLRLTQQGERRLEKPVTNRVKPAYLPKLTALIIEGDTDQKGTVTDKDLVTILKSGFTLNELQLRCSPKPLSSIFPLPIFNTLTSFNLSISSATSEFTGGHGEQLTQVLNRMPALSIFTLNLNCQLSTSVKIDWALPELTTMQLLSTGRFRPPFEFVRLNAPKVTNFWSDTPFDMEICSLLIALPNLQAIELRGPRLEDKELETKVFAKLEHNLQAGGWPRLGSFSSFSSAGIVRALCADSTPQPRPLTALDVLIEFESGLTPADVHQLLRKHTGLKRCTVLVSEPPREQEGPGPGPAAFGIVNFDAHGAGGGHILMPLGRKKGKKTKPKAKAKSKAKSKSKKGKKDQEASGGEGKEEKDDQPEQPLVTNPDLKFLDLSCANDATFRSLLFPTIEQVSLRTNPSLELTSFDPLARACPSLRHLTVRGTTNIGHWTTSQPWPVRELTLYRPPSGLTPQEFLQPFANIERFYLTGLVDVAFLNDFIALAEQGHFKKLQDASIGVASLHDFLAHNLLDAQDDLNHDLIKRLITALPALTHLDLSTWPGHKDLEKLFKWLRSKTFLKKRPAVRLFRRGMQGHAIEITPDRPHTLAPVSALGLFFT